MFVRCIEDRAVGEVQRDSFRGIILFLLLGLAAAAWVALVWQPHDMSMHMTMALRAAPFFASWVVMMVAMMLPTAAPMILAFHGAPTRIRHPDDAFLFTWGLWRLICWCGYFPGLPLMPEYLPPLPPNPR